MNLPQSSSTRFSPFEQLSSLSRRKSELHTLIGKVGKKVFREIARDVDEEQRLRSIKQEARLTAIRRVIYKHCRDSAETSPTVLTRPRSANLQLRELRTTDGEKSSQKNHIKYELNLRRWEQFAWYGLFFGRGCCCCVREKNSRIFDIQLRRPKTKRCDEEQTNKQSIQRPMRKLLSVPKATRMTEEEE